MKKFMLIASLVLVFNLAVADVKIAVKMISYGQLVSSSESILVDGCCSDTFSIDRQEDGIPKGTAVTIKSKLLKDLVTICLTIANPIWVNNGTLKLHWHREMGLNQELVFGFKGNATNDLNSEENDCNIIIATSEVTPEQNAILAQESNA